MVATIANAQTLERLKYNHPGLVVDLGVGLWAWPLPMDFDNDGDLDLVVNCPDKPYNGTYFFENRSGDTAKNKMPVFAPGRRISQGLQNVQVSTIDGKPRVLSPATEYPDFRKSGLSKGVPLPLPANIHPNRVRGNFWKYVDFNGDGHLDIIVGADDWTDYGWDNGYDASGKWTPGPLRGFVYLIANSGTSDAPKYERPSKLQADGKPIEVYGWPCPNFADFDGDGDLDLICGEFLDGFTYFENQGTRTNPLYKQGLSLNNAAGSRLQMDLEMITPCAIDWNRDGDIDLIVGDEDGRVALIEHTGKTRADHTPIFDAPHYFQQEADEIKIGALATPCAYDWDHDGDTDILCGNTAGYILFLENMSGPGIEKPKFATPRPIEVHGKTFRIMAGPNGSIQGPAEAKWGYTSINVGQIDNDSRPDILINSIWGKVSWLQNEGEISAPKMSPLQPLNVEWKSPQPHLAWGWLRPNGQQLLTQWRTTPVLVDWNHDKINDIVMLDHEGYLAFFERNLQGQTILTKEPRRIFFDESGNPLRFNEKKAGGSGRRKLCIVDWDGDGRLDILLNSQNAQWWQNVSGNENHIVFRNRGNVHDRNIEGHDTSPTPVDWNADGRPDLVIGAEDGRLYYLRNPQK
jgi:hypothetical protein